MPTILIVDDSPISRLFLVDLLNAHYRLLEATDGAEALRMVRAERPDLVITDILMPTMDGYEFVRQLRADPAIAKTPVIFCSSYYHEPEALALAQSCGVASVLTKPCAPDAVLHAVNAAFGIAAPPALPPEEFSKEHLRLLTDKLSQKAAKLQRANDRLNELIELGLQLGSERDPRQLLQHFCHATREIIGARYAISGILNGDGVPLRYFHTSGMDADTLMRLGTPDPKRGGSAVVLAQSRCLRLHNPGGDPVALGLTANYPPIHAWLGAPIVSPKRVYGWIGLIDKIGGEEFSAEDERLAGILAAQVGRIYENGSLYADLLKHTTELDQEIVDRKRAEEALRSSDERIHLLLDSTAEAIYGIDLEGRCTFCNAACLRFLGYTHSGQLLGQDMHALMHHTRADGSPYPRAECHIYLALRAGTGAHVEDEVVWRADGTNFPVEYWSYPIRRSDQLLGSVVTFLDVTEKRSAEQAQRKLAAERDALLHRLQLQIERMPLAYLLFDAELRIIDWNPTAERMFGFSKEEVLHMGPPYTKLLPQWERRNAEEITQRICAGDMTAHAINDNLTKDGHTITCRWFNTPLISDDGRFGGLVCLAEDITERRRLQEQFRQAQLRLEHVVSSSPAILFTMSAATMPPQLTWISQNTAELFGYPVEETLKPNWWLEKIHPDDLPAVLEQLHNLQADGRQSHEARFRHEDGKYRWIRSEVRLLCDPAGNPEEIVGSLSDITERKQLEEQFRQSQKMEAVGRLAGGVAHDFNNLLTVITGYSELLLGQLHKDDPLHAFLDQIRLAGERAAGLTRQLLAFSRKQVLQPVTLDLNALVREMEKMLRRLIGADIDLLVKPHEPLWSIKADPGQIEQVLMNLVVNARDAMPGGGHLTIETCNAELDSAYINRHPEAHAGDYVKLAVSDTGTGMDADTQARIFEPFFSTKGEKGTGLGMATVYGIVKQSGGTIDIYSELGVGTAFKIYFPREREPASGPKSSPRIRTTRRGTETVLIAEDEAGVRSLSKLVLQGEGYKVLEAQHGGEALLLCEQFAEKIHLLVTDVVMPQMSGVQLAERLTRLRPDMKVLFLSGYTDDAIVHHGLLQADTPFLQKPFSPVALARKVREVLDS